MVTGAIRSSVRWRSARFLPLPSKSPSFTQLFHHRVGDVIIAPHGLHVVVIVERVDQLEQCLRDALITDFGLERRAPSKLHAFRLADRGFERLGDLVQIFDARPDLMAVFGGFDILCPGVERGFERLVGIARARRIDDLAEPINPWLTLPDVPRFPPFLLNAVRTLVAVRLRLSVKASTISETPPGP